MIIEREHYLSLLASNEQLTAQVRSLMLQNHSLRKQLELQTEVSQQLRTKFDTLALQQKEAELQVNAKQDRLHTDLKQAMQCSEERQKKLLEEKIQQLQGSAWQKNKVLEMRNTANRLENHQLLEFVEKIKKMFKTEGKKEDPSLKQMSKWVKSLMSSKEKVQNTMTSSVTTKIKTIK